MHFDTGGEGLAPILNRCACAPDPMAGNGEQFAGDRAQVRGKQGGGKTFEVTRKVTKAQARLVRIRRDRVPNPSRSRLKLRNAGRREQIKQQQRGGLKGKRDRWGIWAAQAEKVISTVLHLR